ncbi:MAG TPA: DUF3943 domain-containing protein [Polyangia bacterium]|nr:DUF3943 domain-containing protein [Polyangia bacterium]
MRNSIEIVGGLGVSLAWYWRALDFNSQDWDLKWDAESWRRKLTFDAVRFDTNAFATNAISHPRTYTLSYVVARSNGLSAFESFLWTLAASVAWEYLGEFREYPSINDMIMSPISAVATGETLVQLSSFFARGSDNLFNNIAAAVFSPPQAVHNFLDGVSPTRAAWVDRWGFPRDIFHRFEFGVRAGGFVSRPDKSRFKVDLNADLQLRNLPQYLQAEPYRGWTGPGAVTSLNISVLGNTVGLSWARFFGDLSLLGHYRQGYQRDEAGDLRGSGLFLGFATAFDYGTRLRQNRREDRIGVADVLGAMVEFTRRGGGYWLRLEGVAFGNFALVDSFALERYQAGRSLEGIKSVLVERGYYYAFGTTLWPRVRAGYRAWEIGVDIKADYFTSIDGADRYQERLTNDVHLTDGQVSARGWVGYHVRVVPMRFSLSIERERRSGTMGGVSDSIADARAMSGVAVVF